MAYTFNPNTQNLLTQPMAAQSAAPGPYTAQQPGLGGVAGLTALNGTASSGNALTGAPSYMANPGALQASQPATSSAGPAAAAPPYMMNPVAAQNNSQPITYQNQAPGSPFQFNPQANPGALQGSSPQSPYVPQAMNLPQTPNNFQAAPSLEQNALNGGGVSNKQQIQNFMQALNGVGAGSNNAQMNGGTASNAPVGPLVNPNAANLNNGVAGQNPYFTNVSMGNANGSPGNTTFGNNPNAAPYQFNPNANPGTLFSTAYQPSPPQQTTFNGNANPGTLQQTSGMGGNPPGTAQFNGNANPTNLSTASNPPPPQQTTFNPNANPTNLSTAPAAPTVKTANPNGGMLTMSDATQKTRVAPAQSKLENFLQAINAHSYQYKNPALDGKGTFVSPMAQELEQTELGKSAVIETPRGKMVDYARLGGVNLAASAVLYREQQRLQDQVNQLRSKFKLGNK